MCAGAWVLGLHLLSLHAPAYDYQNNVNPGAYVRTPCGQQVGVFRNTLGNASAYVMQSVPVSANVDAFAGLATGYYNPGYYERHTAPLLGVSMRVPLATATSARVSYMPPLSRIMSHTFHLSVEFDF